MAKDWQELTRMTGDDPIIIERIRLINKEIVIEGFFELPPMARLTLEDQIFAAAFLKSHGSIKDMERLFGVSYPTIKNRLNKIADLLDFVDVEKVGGLEEYTENDTLDRLERGEISAKEALELLKIEQTDKKEEIKMSEERRRILNMLAAGKITAAEAEELLDAITAIDDKGEKPVTLNSDDDHKTDLKKLKYLRIMVEPKENGGKGEKVNIRIPMQLLRAGMKLASLIPGHAQDKISDKMKDKGIDIDLRNLDSKSLEDVIASLGAMSIDVDDEKEKVRIFCE